MTYMHIYTALQNHMSSGTDVELRRPLLRESRGSGIYSKQNLGLIISVRTGILDLQYRFALSRAISSD